MVVAGPVVVLPPVIFYILVDLLIPTVIPLPFVILILVVLGILADLVFALVVGQLHYAATFVLASVLPTSV